MHPIGANRLVDAWERGLGLSPLLRALTLLTLSEPTPDIDALALIDVGERDRRLLAVRELLFGHQIDAVAACTRCNENLDLDFTTAQLSSPRPANALEQVTIDDRLVTLRLPNSRDLLAVTELAPEARVAALLERCAAAALSDAAAATVADHMVQLDPMAQIDLALTCPSCGHSWTAMFDIGSFLWKELSEHALRLLAETHTLASAYGWREADILALSGQRRQVYLDLVVGS